MKPEMDPVPIGYVARITHPRQHWLDAPAVEEVCTVVDHMVGGPDRLRTENWFHQNRHNAVRCFDSEEIAWTVLRDEIRVRLERDDSLDPPWRAEILRLPAEKFDLYAFRVLPTRFVNGESEDWSPPELRIAPLPTDYTRLGYDAVGWNNWAPFECSPLLCNFAARDQMVNRFCLFDEAAGAIELARRYSAKDWQPVWPDSGHCTSGRFCAVEVWRKAKPFPEPARCGPVFQWPPDLLLRLVQHKIAHGNVFER